MGGRDAGAGFGAGLGSLINNYQQCGSALGGGLGQEKIYLGGYYLITPYRPFSAFERGQDRTDCVRGLWMTCSINRTISILAAGRSFLLLGTVICM